MKSNHVPTAERLRRRIDNLMRGVSDCYTPIGEGNPYNQCRHCCVSQPEISLQGHRDGCPVPGWAKEVVHYKKLFLDALGVTNPDEREDMMAEVYNTFSRAGVDHLLPVNVDAYIDRVLKIRKKDQTIARKERKSWPRRREKET